MNSDNSPTKAERAPTSPSWFTRLINWFSAPARPVSLGLPPEEPERPSRETAPLVAPVGPQLTGALRRLADRLNLEEVEPVMARGLVQEVCRILPEAHWGNDKDVAAAAAEVVMRWVSVTGPLKVARGGQTVVALVGPTGVGKSTTLAKLAALSSFKDGRKVGLISTDTYRVAAVEQLSAYARLLELPLIVAEDRDQMREALASYSELELVFIDTAGQGPHDEARLKEVQELLGVEDRIHTHLVISATTKHSDTRDILKRFDPLRYDGLIVTKLDESRSHGILLNAPHWCGRPLAYLGLGQNVPQDIEVATAERVADLVLNLSQKFGA